MEVKKIREDLIELGGTVGKGYLGGGEWTGKEFAKRGYYMSYGEINKIVKKELLKKYKNDNVNFKTRGKSFSGGQSSSCYIEMYQEDLFIDRNTAIDNLMREFYVRTWHNYKNENGDVVSIWGEKIYDDLEIKRKCCEYRYDYYSNRYCNSVHNVPDCILTEKAKEIFSFAKSLYLTFIHDESNSMVDYFNRNLYDSYYFNNLSLKNLKEPWEV